VILAQLISCFSLNPVIRYRQAFFVPAIRVYWSLGSAGWR